MFSAAYIGLAIVAALAGLVLAALALQRTRSPVAQPLALLALNQFLWNGSTAGLRLTHDEQWRWLGAVAAPLLVPFALHFVLAFVGRRRALRRWLAATYVVFVTQAVCVGISAARSTGPPKLSFWSALLGLTVAPMLVWGFVLVVRHLLAADSALERLRTWLLIAALSIVAAFGCTDLLFDLGLQVLPLSNVGSFAFNLLLGIIAFRLGLLSDGSNVRRGLFALLVALGGAAVALFAFLLLQGSPALFALAAGSATLIAVVVTRRVLAIISTQREGLSRAANLGRFSAQMAHDLKNPIAASRGAIQFLEEEVRRGGDLTPHAHFLTLVRDQLERMTTTVERYQRLAKVEPARTDLDVDALVSRVLALAAFAGGPGLTVTKDVAAGLPKLHADPDLLGTALENLVRNAVEALPDGKGAVTVRAGLDETYAGEVLCLSVSDTGVGVDARKRELVFEPFFTTKAGGTGIGLPWVLEVVRAHGGEVKLHSREGKGTVVELRLPLGRPEGLDAA